MLGISHPQSDASSPSHHGYATQAFAQVEAGERLPEPADDLEFLNDSASVNAAGLRQEDCSVERPSI